MATYNPNPGDGGERPSDEHGQSVSDAVEGSYDEWDRSEHGIAEGDRKQLGGWLGEHAAAAGTTIETGLQSLVETASVLRNADQQTKRTMIGHLADTYDVRPYPSAAELAPPLDEFGDPVSGAAPPIASEARVQSVVDEFVRANPVAADPAIQQAMIDQVESMGRQGQMADLPTLLQHAIARDPRYSEQARQAHDNEQVARAKSAAVQVSGAGNVRSPSGGSADIGDILDELVPRD